MIEIYHPYIIGSEKPIPYLFEKIIPEISEHVSNITTFTNQREGVLDISNVDEKFVGDITSVSGAIRFRLKYPLISLQRFNLIHTGGRASNHLRMARLARKRNSELAHLHTLRVDVDPEQPQHTANKKLAEMADEITAVSKHTAQTAEDILGVEPRVVYNGVDSQVFKPGYKCPDQLANIDDEFPVFLFVGSFVDRKRPRDVVEVAKKCHDAMFIMIGAGSLLKEVKKESKGMNNVKILGRLPKHDLPPIYANADGLVFPSIKEGCPNVVMEAMASGLPIVGYRATSIPELVSHMQTGYLAEPQDTEELAEGINFVIDSNENMGENARSYVKSNHSFGKIANEYYEIYKEIS